MTAWRRQYPGYARYKIRRKGGLHGKETETPQLCRLAAGQPGQAAGHRNQYIYPVRTAPADMAGTDATILLNGTVPGPGQKKVKGR